MIRHVNLIDGIPSGEFETDHDFLKPTRHMPTSNPTHDCNTSPVEGYTFAQSRSIQNVQSLLYSPGANKYICKYIGNMDENNRIIVSTNAHKNSELIPNLHFFIIQKIATSAFNEKAAMEKSKKKAHPRRRKISFYGNASVDFEIS